LKCKFGVMVSVSLLADDAAATYFNNTLEASQPYPNGSLNFQLPASSFSFYTPSSAGTLDFLVYDAGIRTGLDYSVIARCATTITHVSGRSGSGNDEFTSFCQSPLGPTAVSDYPGATVGGQLPPGWDLKNCSPPTPAGPIVIPTTTTAWKAPLPGSNWVGPNVAGTSLSGVHFYVYDFDVEGCNSVNVNGSLMADDAAAVYYNHTLEASQPYPATPTNHNFHAVFSFQFSANATAGSSLFEFLVYDNHHFTGFDDRVNVTCTS
jgi:hypothetical protein